SGPFLLPPEGKGVEGTHAGHDLLPEGLYSIIEEGVALPENELRDRDPFFLLSIAAVPFLGTEFMPTLEEGNIWLRATLPMTTNLPYASKIVDQTRSL